MLCEIARIGLPIFNLGVSVYLLWMIRNYRRLYKDLFKIFEQNENLNKILVLEYEGKDLNETKQP